jgi:hypothetical protein
MLYLDITGRNDWSSTLPSGKNNYFYPSATLSWLFTNLIPKNDILSFGKLRLGFGIAGKDADLYYTNPAFASAYSDAYYGLDVVNFPMNSTNAFLATPRAASSTLQPEMTTEFEVGTQLQFFNNRIGIDFAYYDRTTDKQIFPLPVDPATGYTSMVMNMGKVNNHGIELLLNVTPVKTKNFQWDLAFNFTRNVNEVVSMPEGLEGGKVTIYTFSAGNDAVNMYAEVGKPIGVYYTYLPQFVTEKTSEHYGKPIVNSYGQPVLGDEVEYTGFNMNNKWTGGVTTAFTAYGVTLSATLDVRYGGYMFSRTKNLMQFTGNGKVTTYNDRNPFVVPNSVVDNGDGTYSENTAPIKLSDSSYQNYFDKYGWGNGGNAYLVDRSYAKLRNISLGWELPAKWVKPTTLSSISVSAFVNNAFTWTAADNSYVDPETSTLGTDLRSQFGELYSNPSARIYGCNLSIKF